MTQNDGYYSPVFLARHQRTRHTSPGQDAAAAAEQNTEPRQLILISVTLVQQIARQAPAQEGWVVRGDTVLRWDKELQLVL